MNFEAIFPAPFGKLGIHCSAQALSGIEFLPPETRAVVPREALAKEVCAQLEAYFRERTFRFDLPLELNGTTYRCKVWQALGDIPCGEVLTYGELAVRLHSAPRAVGQACGHNPIPVVIPCHRVVGKSGLGGFMHRADDGALDIKRWLLAHERR
jgi:methylated-DNA-[protein]-cysteine S-methyltransferase